MSADGLLTPERVITTTTRSGPGAPPVDPNAPPPPQDAAGRVGEDAPADNDGRQTSHKAGSRSIAQKEDDRRYPDSSMPPTRKVSGAFGKEPQE